MTDESPQDKIQRIQTEYRRRLAQSWTIPEHSNVLEIGCGQGDMTAVLAEIVGKEGSVVAVDRAGRNYGAPQTLGEATDAIKATEAGSRIRFLFDFDILNHRFEWEEDGFDAVVLAHSSWYFSSRDELAKTLQSVQHWAKTLCFAEWDMQPTVPEQFPHLLAVLIQALVESFKPESQANIRTPLSSDVVHTMLINAGWNIKTEESIDASSLQDADWEIQECLRSSLSDAQSLGLSEKVLDTVKTQVDLLKQISLPEGNKSLNAYSIVAEHSPSPRS